jgi:hypothetical protein
MPNSGVDVPVRLVVTVEGTRERWTRQVGDRTLTTVQWEVAGLLLESFGPITLATSLKVDGCNLSYQFERAWFAGIPLPRWLAPSATSEVRAGEGGWFVSTRICAPVVGEIVHYEGWVDSE